MTPSEQAICNLCGGTHFTTLEEDEPPFRVLKCRTCSLVFVHPVPGDQVLSDHYDEGYYDDWIHGQKKRRLTMWAKRLERLNAYGAKGRLLDVGCGDGAFLSLAQEQGWEVMGTEISPYAARYTGARLGVEIFCGELTAAGFPDQRFDAVTLWHVWEHVKDPMAYLLDVRRILKPSGLMILAVPNVNDRFMQVAYRIVKGRPLKLFSKTDREVHLYHFSDSTIRAYLRKAGFRCQSIGPDFGTVDWRKKIINMVALIPFYVTGTSLFNAFEVHAVPGQK